MAPMTTGILSLLGLACFVGYTEGLCFKHMTEPTGEFHSPGYPQDYTANQKCDYTIAAPSGYLIQITFTKFRLQPEGFPEQGVVTDHIEMIDGKERNIKQRVVIQGWKNEVFTVYTRTQDVKLTFISDDSFEFPGFSAKYKFVKMCKGTDPKNGQSVCDGTEEGLVTHCNVTCNERYVPELGSIGQCTEEGLELPRCVPDPAYECSTEKILEYKPDCKRDKKTGEIKKCKYSCKKNYVPAHNGTLKCVGGVFNELPKCTPDPDVMEGCLNVDESVKCPFNLSEVRSHVIAEFGESESLQSASGLGRSSNGEIIHDCSGLMCRRTRTTLRYWSCKNYAKFIVNCLKLKPKKARREKRQNVCQHCQAKDCPKDGVLTPGSGLMGR